MTEPAIRPEVVALFTGVIPVGDPTTWKHDDGRPVTHEELELLMTATPAELQAVADYSRRAKDHAVGQAETAHRITNLLAPYFQQLPRGTVVDDVLPLLTPEDRAEYEQLAELAAPDGTIVLPRDPRLDNPTVQAAAAHYVLSITENTRVDDLALGDYDGEPELNPGHILTMLDRLDEAADALADSRELAPTDRCTAVQPDGQILYCAVRTMDTADTDAAMTTLAARAVRLEYERQLVIAEFAALRRLRHRLHGR